MALLQQLRFDRSASVHSQKSSAIPKQNLPRSSSARARHIGEPVLQPHHLLHNQDVALATVSLKPVPFGPLVERILVTSGNYGSIPRYYVMTGEDHALTSAMQEKMVELNPPTRVFRMKGGDHAPFFPKPQALHKLLLEIALIGAEKEAQ